MHKVTNDDAMVLLLSALKDWMINTTDLVDEDTKLQMMNWIQTKQLQVYREGMTPQQWWFALYNALEWENPPPCPV